MSKSEDALLLLLDCVALLILVDNVGGGIAVCCGWMGVDFAGLPTATGVRLGLLDLDASDAMVCLAGLGFAALDC